MAKTFKLTPLQKGMLSYHVLWPDSGVDIEQIMINLPENMNTPYFKQAWHLVFQNYDILRACFKWIDIPEPLHVIPDEVNIPFEYDNWSQYSDQEITRQQKNFLSDDRRQGFDLSAPPLSRLYLVQLGENKYRLFWSFHHILMDGRSFSAVLSEVFNQYESLKQGIPCKAINRVPFENYIDWLATIEKNKAQQFWKERLKGFTSQTTLPFEMNQSDTAIESRYGEVDVFLSKKLTASLNEYAQISNVTLNTLLLAAWSLLLSRHSGSQDVMFGTTKTTRSSSIKGAKDIIGLFLTTLPIRVLVDENVLIKDWVQSIRQDWIAMRPYEQVALNDLRNWSELNDAKGLFDSLVIFENEQFEKTLKASAPQWEKRDIQLLESTNFSFTLLGYGGEQIRLKLEYDANQYSEKFVRNILTQVATVLKSMSISKESTLKAIEMLSDHEKHWLFDKWNQTVFPYDETVSISKMVATQAQQNPQSIAVRFEQQQLTYAELDHQASHLALQLDEVGVRQGMLVGIGLERSLNMILSLLAVFKVGAAYVPLDPAFPKDRLALMIEDSGLPFLLTSRSTEHLFEENRIQKINVTTCLDNTAPETTLAEVSEPNSLAYILYTSGSTGRPKGVKITQKSVLNFLHAMSIKPGMVASDVLLSVTTLSFDISVLELFLPLINGAQLVLVDRETVVDGRQLLKKIQENHPTLMQATPATFRMLLDAGFSNMPDLTLLCGGEAMPPDLAKSLLSRCKKLWNMYGPTETTIWSTIEAVTTSTEKITIGRPINNTRIYILDAYLRPVPLGAVGELCIGGDGVAAGYHHLPGLTSEKFVNVTFNDAEAKRIYRTGDLARYQHDGKIVCLGRVDQQIKIRGFRVELGDIETALTEHENIHQAAVALIENGNGKKQLVAYLVLDDDVDNFTVFREYLSSKLPAYMIPSVYIKLKVLPLTPNKKIDRKSLPHPKASELDTQSCVVEPKTHDEFQMKMIWERILNIQNISIIDNFFDIGGDSLLSVTLLIEIEKEWGCHLRMQTLVEAPTITQLVLKLSDDKKPASILVTMRQSEEEAATVFLIPGAAGHSMALLDYAFYINKACSVYALEISGYDTNHSVEVIAKQALQEIKKIQPHGPYCFVGLCFGALVTFEMACQLVSQGEKVTALELLDPPPLEAKLSVKLLCIIVTKHLLRIFNQNPLTTFRSFFNLIGFQTNKISREDMITGNSILDLENEAHQSIEALDNARDLRIEAGKKYKPNLYYGTVDIFYVKENGIYKSTMSEKSWEKVTCGPTEKYLSKGGHGDFFSNPYVEKIVRVLNKKLYAEIQNK